MTTTQNTPLNDLGCMNGWYDENDERRIMVNTCWREKHPMTQETIGTCYNRYVCKKCRITFTIDSSD